MCPGILFALRSLGLTLATLIQHFVLQKPSNELIDTSETPGLINNKATPLMVLLSPRLSSNMYHLSKYLSSTGVELNEGRHGPCISKSFLPRRWPCEVVKNIMSLSCSLVKVLPHRKCLPLLRVGNWVGNRVQIVVDKENQNPLGEFVEETVDNKEMFDKDTVEELVKSSRVDWVVKSSRVEELQDE
ncbi:hypothetical protein OSB04_003466 [Centaurea solstitialis]|uniref:Cytochrome P450 n=1 Tax=Centaurea solstitialis TaxID=347529 RepID=A0AA38WTS0_9ASTR|nr:hypothetical protein OSB04_003466 [Centaurea solstitialis]